MKDIVKRLQTYLAFERPVEIKTIDLGFSRVQNQQQKIIPGWSTSSTRQKLIYNYWFSQVIGHFTAVLGIALLFTFAITRKFNSYILLILLVAGLLSFLIMLFWHYLPKFTSEFMPNLETVKSIHDAKRQKELINQLRNQLAAQKEEMIQQQKSFEATLYRELSEHESRILKQQERTQRRLQEHATETKLNAEQQQEELKKCRQAQLSNFALTLIFCVWTRSAGISGVTGNDHTAHLLQQLYGVDRGSLRNNLELISGTSSKRKNLGERKLTEIRNRFEEARAFLKQLNYPQGVSMLNELENKILGNR